MSSKNRKRNKNNGKKTGNAPAPEPQEQRVKLTTAKAPQKDPYVSHTNIGSHRAPARSQTAAQPEDETDNCSVSSLSLGSLDVAHTVTSETAEHTSLEKITAEPVNKSPEPSTGLDVEVVSASAAPPAARSAKPSADREAKLQLLRSAEVFKLPPQKRSVQVTVKPSGGGMRMFYLLPLLFRFIVDLAAIYLLAVAHRVRGVMSLSFVGDKVLNVVDFIIAMHLRLVCKGTEARSV